MKCLVCGADMKGAAVCEICEKKTKRPAAELEVEYKDFKISEFLEIRSRRQETEELPETGDGVSPGENIPEIPGPGGKFLRLVPIIIISALAAGIILLLRLFSLL